MYIETSGFTNSVQMAKRMKYSVVGLPHYTIWHLYEPSVDDIKHMEEMERERLAKEKEEAEKKAKEQKLGETFGDTRQQWEKDNAQIKNIQQQQQQQQQQGQQGQPQQQQQKPAVAAAAGGQGAAAKAAGAQAQAQGQ